MNQIPKIRLLTIDDAMEHAFQDGAGAFARQFGAALGASREQIGEVLVQSLKHLDEVPREPPFGCYLTVDATGSIVVGTCGFTSGPNENESVEMAYYTFPPFEGRGYATAAAEAMIELARRSRRVRCVFAHTLPERNASCRILEKICMNFAGEFVVPKDGRIWRWELPLDS
ncbi:MAG: GNAT family N-acetyltransferase [Planctomycetes bacterium]|nr:GNAT family N-acetyltransferase [Planctomycetota bacterium]MBI3835915.1 GNAT family N-acetyltransferase [Planctomycetota bacterium]